MASWMSNWIKVGGVTLPAPSTYKVSLSDLDSENSSRNEKGKLKRQRIRSQVYKIESTWKIPVSQAKVIVDAFSPKEFSVTFFDVTSGNYITKSMYAGDKTADVLQIKDNKEDTYLNFACNLIEL